MLFSKIVSTEYHGWSQNRVGHGRLADCVFHLSFASKVGKRRIKGGIGDTEMDDAPDARVFCCRD
jgi:hypothetical protein